MNRESRKIRFWTGAWVLCLTILLSGCSFTLLNAEQMAAEATTNLEEDSRAAEPEEAESADAGQSDAGQSDAGQSDAGQSDAGTAEALPTVPLSERVIDSIFGGMLWFESDEYDFAILRPDSWDEISAEECSSPGATVCFVGGPGGMIITEESLSSLPRQNRDRDGYVDFLFEIFGDGGDFEIIQFAESQTEQGDPVDIFTLSSQEDEITLERFIFVDEEEQIAFNATAFIATEMYETLTPAIGYVQDSFRFWPMDDRSESAVYHLDEGRWHLNNEEYAAAIESLSQAVEIDPDLRIGYQLRGLLYREEKLLDEALSDADRVVELSPQLPNAYRERGLAHYLLNNYDEALADLKVAIELDPSNPSHNNLRALVYAVSGNPEPGVEDMDAALIKSGGTLPIHIQDTRGFVYLVMGEFEKAKDDYDAIFAQEEEFGHALLGAGIAYYEVGETDSGIALIEAGLAEFEEDELKDPEPQLMVLMELADKILDGLE